MKVKGLLIIPMVCLLGFGSTGCSSSQQAAPKQDSGAAQSPSPTQQPAQNHSEHQHEDQGNQTGGSPSTSQVGKAIQDELKGLTTIEEAVNKGDFETASKIFEPLHDEYHAAVLAPIQAKNAKLAEDMHSKLDALDSAIDSKDKNKILSAIKINRDSLNQAAKELGL